MLLFDYETLKLIWWGIIGVLLIGFAITDGMDMGVGMLLPFIGKNDNERRVIINTIGPHWDGNQVWFITAGGALFAGWPMVYAAAFSGFYFAMMLVLFALFLRPIGFDYRSKIADQTWRHNWDRALFIGSSVPPFVFGIAFGNLLLGVPFHFDEFLRVTYTGSFFALFNPFSLLCGVVSVAMLTMQGAMWLQMRTTDDIAMRAQKIIKYATFVFILSFTLAGICLYFYVDGYVINTMPDAGSAITPLDKVVVIQAKAWLLNYEKMPFTLIFPILGISAAWAAYSLANHHHPALGFAASSLAITATIATVGFALFPFLMPSSSHPDHSLTLWDAVSSQYSLNIMLIAVIILLPIVLSYTIWCYIRMWRKITVDEIKKTDHSAY